MGVAEADAEPTAKERLAQAQALVKKLDLLWKDKNEEEADTEYDYLEAHGKFCVGDASFCSTIEEVNVLNELEAQAQYERKRWKKAEKALENLCEQIKDAKEAEKEATTPSVLEEMVAEERSAQAQLQQLEAEAKDADEQWEKVFNQYRGARNLHTTENNDSSAAQLEDAREEARRTREAVKAAALVLADKNADEQWEKVFNQYRGARNLHTTENNDSSAAQLEKAKKRSDGTLMARRGVYDQREGAMEEVRRTRKAVKAAALVLADE